MAKTNKVLVNFNGGEWSPRLHARVDLEKSASACRTLENVIVETYGVARRRAGTLYVGNAGSVAPIEGAVMESRTLTSGEGSGGDDLVLRGYAELCNPSVPPRYYLTISFSGGVNIDGANSGYPGNEDCAGDEYDPGSHARITWSGTKSKNPYTGAETDNSRQVTELPIGTVLYDGSVAFSSTPPEGCSSSGCESSSSWSKTSYSLSTHGGCCYVDSGWRRASGGFSAGLSNEATESALIANLVATGTYSAWAAVATHATDVLAFYQPRTSGDTWKYRDTQFRVTLTGRDPGSQYGIRVPVYRRAYGVGTFELYQTLATTATANGSGVVQTAATQVPNTQGYETYAGEPIVTPIP